MLHILRFLGRTPGTSETEFQRRWHAHAPRLEQFPVVLGYAQIHRRPLPDGIHFPPGGVPLEFDGVSELWLADAAAWDALQRDDAYRRLVAADEATFADPTRTLEVHLTDHPVIDCAPLTADDRLLKQFNLIKRRPGLPLADFRRHYRTVFPGTSVRAPHQRNYWQSLATDASYADGEPPADGCSQIWFADLAGLAGFYGSAEIVDTARAAFEFLTSMRFLAGEEYRTIWPATPPPP